jgi:hypothetical protein
MSDCATQTMRFETESALALEAAFDGGRLTSDGGLLWLSEVDSEMGLCEAISECVPEWRTRKARHSLASLVRQRVFQIACGYEDQNDSDTLREDPLLKLSCGTLPESGPSLASQPTISRMENAPTRRSCHQIAEVLFELYLTQREKDGAPEKVLLDFDATDDPTHGEQEGSYYHGYYRQHIYLPSAARIRRRERALDHGAFEGWQHPRLQLICCSLEAHRDSPERKMARGGHRDKGGCRLRRPCHLRLL